MKELKVDPECRREWGWLLRLVRHGPPADAGRYQGIAGGANLGQCFRSHLNVKAFRALDLLSRDLNGRILPQRRQDCLIQGKPRNSRTRSASVGPGQSEVRQPKGNKRDQEGDRVYSQLSRPF